MEDVFGRLGEILRPQFDLLNEAERTGDDIIVKTIVDDYNLLPSDIYDTDTPPGKSD